MMRRRMLMAPYGDNFDYVLSKIYGNTEIIDGLVVSFADIANYPILIYDYIDLPAGGYIDTGLPVRDFAYNVEVLAHFKMLNEGDFDWWGSSKTESGEMAWNVDNTSAANAYLRWGATTTAQAVEWVDGCSAECLRMSDDYSTVQVGFSGEKVVIYRDGDVVGQFGSKPDFSKVSATTTFCINKARNTGSAQRMFSYELKNTGDGFHRFLPASREGVFGCYDRETRSFIHQSGNRVTSYGSVVETIFPDNTQSVIELSLLGNLFDRNTAFRGDYDQHTGAKNVGGANKLATDFIPVDSAIFYKVSLESRPSWFTASQFNMYTFDADRKFVASYTLQNNAPSLEEEFSVDAGVKYMALSTFDTQVTNEERLQELANVLTITARYKIELGSPLCKVGDVCDSISALGVERRIDSSVLVPTKPVDEQVEAILGEPVYEAVALPEIVVVSKGDVVFGGSVQPSRVDYSKRRKGR